MFPIAIRICVLITIFCCILNSIIWFLVIIFLVEKVKRVGVNVAVAFRFLFVLVLLFFLLSWRLCVCRLQLIPSCGVQKHVSFMLLLYIAF